ncbi:hypothetical protein [Companilactobacillus sp. DQM5]|uniref:hypothetical protein n=1 Tax=Companilactobacillus sp. DQM5 TaxID=3463359 RepID=UPI00405941D9
MTKEELLNYLHEKRSQTVGVANAQQNLNIAERKLTKGKRKFHRTIITLWILAGIYLLTDIKQYAWVFAIPALILMAIKYFFYIMPANELVGKKKEELQVEIDNPVYQNGSKGFPEKFYNYTDAYRLYKLVEENRARDLQEAFNLLETQHFQEDQMSIQEEIKAMQQDIADNTKSAATSAGIAAAASTFNALRK